MSDRATSIPSRRASRLSLSPMLGQAKATRRLGGRTRQAARSPGKWVYAVLLLQFGCQLLLDFVNMGGFRVVVRTAAFAVSLLFLAFLPGRGRMHPAGKAAMAVLGIVGIGLFNPDTASFLAGAAQIGMYLAILAPLFWGPRLDVDEKVLQRALLLIFAFHTTSAAIGVLQVYFPGQFQPNLSQMITSQGESYVESLMIDTAAGERTFRPMGLTDVPGGAAMSGFYAFMLGTGFLLSVRKLRWRLLCVGAMFVGVTVLYLSYVRSVLVLLAITMLAMGAVLLIRRRARELTTFALVVGAVGVVGLSAAVALGGQGVMNRVSSLVDDAPTEVYQRNRGHFLEYTFSTLLPEYPFGAGLARWGMMNVYFADRTIQDSSDFWVEIQWTGWMLDGGAPLALAYFIALLLALWVSFRAAIGRLGHRSGVFVFAVLIFAYDIGALALTFNYTFFASQSGLEFWMINALLFAAATRPIPSAPSPARPRPGAPEAAPPEPGAAPA